MQRYDFTLPLIDKELSLSQKDNCESYQKDYVAAKELFEADFWNKDTQKGAPDYFYRHNARYIYNNLIIDKSVGFWLRERDLNPRPSGYEPDELPDCSIPRPIEKADQRSEVDGVEGFEPPNDWTKTSCLTAWRYPIRLCGWNYISKKHLCQEFFEKKRVFSIYTLL